VVLFAGKLTIFTCRKTTALLLCDWLSWLG